MMFANTPAAMAPWGGSKALFGTNPVAFACPLPGRAPLVIDLSLSKVARGNVVTAKQRGEKLPPGWALDEKGQPTSDPDAALRGTMLPMGDAKGTALALMVELMAAGMIGANYAAEASSYLDAEGPPSGTGQLIIAFDPAGVRPARRCGRFAALAVAIESQHGARLPGERQAAAPRQGQSRRPCGSPTSCSRRSRRSSTQRLQRGLFPLQRQRLIAEHAVDDHLARGVEIDLVLLQEVRPRR